MCLGKVLSDVSRLATPLAAGVRLARQIITQSEFDYPWKASITLNLAEARHIADLPTPELGAVSPVSYCLWLSVADWSTVPLP